MISGEDLGKILLGAGLGAAGTIAGGLGVLAVNFSAREQTPELVEIGAVVLGVGALGYFLGGRRPGTIGRGVMYGAAVLPAYLLLNVATTPKEMR